MLKATKELTLPTTITGSLPRPVWYTENLASPPFRDALADARFREQYTDAVGTYLRDQERAGLDIVTDGDARFACPPGKLPVPPAIACWPGLLPDVPVSCVPLAHAASARRPLGRLA